MPASTYLANKLLEHQVGKTSYTSPTVYVGLSSTTPTLAGGNITEPTTGDYARVATAGSDWNTAAGGSIDNANLLSFPQASADWVSGANLTHGVLFDAATNGNVLGYGALATPKNVLTGDTATIGAGQLVITLS